MTDSETLDALIQKYREREKLGFVKYGTTIDRTDLYLRDWLQHALEESMDHCLYLMRAIATLETRNGDGACS